MTLVVALLRRLPWHIDAEFQKYVAEGVHLINAASTGPCHTTWLRQNAGQPPVRLMADVSQPIEVFRSVGR